MAVIAVVNRKGGSGKSTLATHVACYLATRGLDVMLGDVDRQQSARLWLNLRPESRPKIHGWTIDDRNFARPPAGVKHVVLDTPGGFQGVGLMKVAMYADAILIPATPSLFDRQSAAECLKELRVYPRVQTGKCRVASIGMRIDGRTKNAALLAAWAQEQGLHHLGTIKEAQAYPRCLEQGLTLFDFPPAKVAGYLPEWTPVTAWIDQLLGAEVNRVEPERPERPVPNAFRPSPPVLVRPAPNRLEPASLLPKEVEPMGYAGPAFLRA